MLPLDESTLGKWFGVTITRGMLGPALKMHDLNETELDFSFRVLSAKRLRKAISSAGWLGMPDGPPANSDGAR